MPGRVHMEFAKILPSIGYRSNHSSLQSSGMVPTRSGHLDFRNHPFGPRALTNGPASHQHQHQMQMMMLQAGANLARLTTGRDGSYGTGMGSSEIDIQFQRPDRPVRSPSPSEHSDGGSAIVSFPPGGRTTSHEQLLRQPETASLPVESVVTSEVTADKLSPPLANDPVHGAC